MNCLKKIVPLISIMFLSATLFAQIAIGKTSVDGSGILDFGIGKGLVLPWVQTVGSTYSDGTLIFDTSDNKVKVRINNGWFDLSENPGTLNATKANAIAAHLLKDEESKIYVIGSTAPSANGVLVLESNDSALILPKMASPHLNMVDPEPGTIVYDTVANLMCVFNGEEWTFWGE